MTPERMQQFLENYPKAVIHESDGGKIAVAHVHDRTYYACMTTHKFSKATYSAWQRLTTDFKGGTMFTDTQDERIKRLLAKLGFTQCGTHGIDTVWALVK